MPIIALTRKPGPALVSCELTFAPRRAIDIARAIKQHTAYEQTLEAAGVTLIRLPEDPRFPDGVFVEDPVVVLDEVAIVTRPGVPSRQEESEAISREVAKYRKLQWLQAPAALDGGDVLHIGKTIFVGASQRTNSQGIAQLSAILAPFGYRVISVPIRGCLHLKSAITLACDRLLVARSDSVDLSLFLGLFSGMEVLEAAEPEGANVLAIGERVLVSSSAPKTAEQLAQRGLNVETVDISELEKAEAGLTCLSLLWESSAMLPPP